MQLRDFPLLPFLEDELDTVVSSTNPSQQLFSGFAVTLTNAPVQLLVATQYVLGSIETHLNTEQSTSCPSLASNELHFTYLHLEPRQ